MDRGTSRLGDARTARGARARAKVDPRPELELELELCARAWRSVRAASARAEPDEAAGLLLGLRRGARALVHCALRARCSSASPRSFELEPLELVHAQARAERLGLELIGTWHSHPGGSAEFSAADRAGAQAGWSHLVHAPRCADGAPWRAWHARLAPDGALELREERVRLADPSARARRGAEARLA